MAGVNGGFAVDEFAADMRDRLDADQSESESDTPDVVLDITVCLLAGISVKEWIDNTINMQFS